MSCFVVVVVFCLHDVFLMYIFFAGYISGPRFVLNLIRVFEGSFGGPTLYENPHYQSPNEVNEAINECVIYVSIKFSKGKMMNSL